MMSPRVMSSGRSMLGRPRRVARNSPGLNVRVIVRVRPFLTGELLVSDGKPHSCIQVSKSIDGVGDDNLLIKDQNSGRSESYKLDSCYGENHSINHIFSMELEPLLPMLWSGCNATVFAYGATGSGKTHTMQGLEEEPGLIPLAMMNLLSLASAAMSTVEVSYYEVYMDRCYDLIEPKAAEVSVLEDSNGRIQLKGLTHVKVRTIEEFFDIFSTGCANRKIGRTGVNDASSRSHGILMVTVTTESDEGPQVGKLKLIDLAGNEDNRKTGNEGVRLAESGCINQSLFALSNVINALNANEARVPYRDSKLTRILQDSLGGNSSALMIACLNPGSYQEGIHTLNLAARSRLIVNRFEHAKKNETASMEKVDMATKLQAWREANGKIPGKASPKYFSPLRNKALFIRTPSRFHPLNYPLSHQKATTEQHLSSQMNKISISSAERGNDFSKPELHDAENEHLWTEGKPFLCNIKHELDYTATKDRNDYRCLPSDVKVSANRNLTHNINTKLDDTKGIILDASGCVTICNATVRHVAFADEVTDGKENKIVRFGTPMVRDVCSLDSPPLSQKLRNLGSALREALSPLSSNTNIVRNINTSPKGFTPRNTIAVFQTPDTQCDSPCGWTPLEKFNTSSREIQGMLVTDYVNILNTGTREQLLQLKGIGERRADYILKLRETSEAPITGLRDLEKIGVSARQAYGIFNGNVMRQILSTPL